ncbi:protein UXT homolog [Agrilus planipennis]|uniref:Protein UXT homolog n=1 Tax=Agrilus planipennis TaxID=224129 RepID=A0A1W4XFP7_AGRPL|nr:protein UXT homolog [Agrilus planipennis]
MAEKLNKNKIEEYENFIEKKLKRDLAEIEEILEKKYENYSHWADLKSLIQGLKLQQNEEKEYDIAVDMGCSVFAHGRIEEENVVFVNIGCECYLPMDYNEASKYADIRIKVIEREMEHYRKLAVQVKMNIKLFLLAIEELNTNFNN